MNGVQVGWQQSGIEGVEAGPGGGFRDPLEQGL